MAASWAIDELTRIVFVLQVVQVEVILHVEGIHFTEMCRYLTQFLHSDLLVDLFLLFLWHLPYVYIHIFLLEMSDP